MAFGETNNDGVISSGSIREGQLLSQDETTGQENDGQVVRHSGEEETNTQEVEAQSQDVDYGVDFPFVDGESDTSGGEEEDDKGRRRVRPTGLTFPYTKDVLPAAYSHMEAHYNGPWSCWNKVPTTTKDLWFDEFATEFFWKDKNAHKVRWNWGRKCSEHLRYTLRRGRKKGTKPPFVKRAHWDEIMAEWDTDEWKKLSEANQMHRACQKSVFTGGSKNTNDIQFDFEKKTGRRMTQEELIKATCRKKKTGEWTGPKPQAIIDHYVRLCNQFKETHPEEMTNEDARRLWAIAAGNGKGKLFAQGSLNKPVRDYRNPAAHGSSSQRKVFLDNNQLEDFKKSIEEDVRKSIEDEVRKSIEEDVRRSVATELQQIQARQQKVFAQKQRAQIQQTQALAQTYAEPSQQPESSFMALLNSTGHPTTFPGVSIPPMNFTIPSGYNMGDLSGLE